MKSITYALVLMAMGTLPLFAAESNGAASQSQERIVQEFLYDLSDSTFFFSCGPNGETLPITEGEPIDVEGHVFERITVLYDGVGGIHTNMNSMPVNLRGIGVYSGEEFRVVESGRVVANQRDAGIVGSYTETFKMVGQTTHRSFSMVGRGHYVIDANGDITVSRDVLRVECR